ncbi:hypothetical protein BCR42DRAFT_486112 [Absidia repens]|uniref:NmrA-like domain-containing protein n=1 Tax=Absidia repens TaxID=90262 RepID=A0A1X2J2F6_9FUNG|nr:hypothetical protein BCR42DRAFT_486112 [Absidia repens]
MSSEKVYVIGATGNIGTKVVRDLLAKGVETTIYVRSAEKSKSLFGESKLLNVVEGDYADMTKFKASIPGHTRLFLVIADLDNMPALKEEIAADAYEGGVKQIVDLSSRFAQFPWKTSIIGEAHHLAEERIYALALKHKRNVVTLRPSRFHANHLWVDNPTIKAESTIYDSNEDHMKLEWISTDDIADVATLILTDPTEVHGNRAYPLIGDSVDGPTRASYFSKALGRTITYKYVDPRDKYQTLLKSHIPPQIALDLATVQTFDPPTLIVPILLGRPYETLESWINKNIAGFQ